MNVAATLSSNPHVGVASSNREELRHLRDESGIDLFFLTILYCKIVDNCRQ